LSVRQMKVPAVWGIRVMWPAQRGAAIDLAQALSSEAENVIVATSAQVRHHAHAIAKADAVVQFHRGGQLSHDVPDRNGQFHVNARLLGDTVEQPVSDSRRNQVRVPQDKATADVFWRDGELSALISNSNPLGRACQRLGRVLLGQSVGLALGGGGAWGFAHVALLRGLENAGIAVDYVAGSSFGSLVAGLYAAGGMEALDALMRHRARIQTVLLTSTVSTRPITRFVNDLIGEVRLEDTEIPFFPVTADLFTSQEVILERGTVSDGVRASSSLPPVFPSMPSGTTRLVDGGIINIVPASVVWDAGADFVLASNVIPRTTLTLTSETRLSRRMPDWTKPLERLSDFMQSAYLLMWRSGVDRGREADYTIDLGLSEHRMHEFAQGDAIVDKALGHVDAHMTHIVRAYQSACALYTAEA
ncbi:MAG: patatin-like phospholipase family protein, partial [Myxococcota bacterium]